MKLENINIQQINCNNKLPLSYKRNYKDLKESIQNIGLINPVILFPISENNYKIISGYLRTLALKELNLNFMPAIILNKTLAKEKLWEIALSSNIERGFNLAEISLILNKIKELNNKKHLLEIIKIPNNLKLQENALKALKLPSQALDLLANNRLDYTDVDLIYNYNEEEQKIIFNIFTLLNPSQQKRKQWLELLNDIARQKDTNIKDIFSDKKINIILSDPKSQTEELARNYLWEKRNPILNKLKKIREEEIKSFKLPKNLKFISDNNFEDINFSFNLNFKNLKELEQLNKKISELLKHEKFKQLLNLKDQNI